MEQTYHIVPVSSETRVTGRTPDDAMNKFIAGKTDMKGMFMALSDDDMDLEQSEKIGRIMDTVEDFLEEKYPGLRHKDDAILTGENYDGLASELRVALGMGGCND